jgi:hypothetical protein
VKQNPVTIEAQPEFVEEVRVKASSRKREFAAAAAATSVTVILGLIATGAINHLGEIVKNKVNPPVSEKEEETDSE